MEGQVNILAHFECVAGQFLLFIQEQQKQLIPFLMKVGEEACFPVEIDYTSQGNFIVLLFEGYTLTVELRAFNKPVMKLKESGNAGILYELDYQENPPLPWSYLAHRY